MTSQTLPGIDLHVLTDYLGSRVEGGLAGPLLGDIIAGGRSNPTYALTDGDRSWILRRPPLGDVPRGAHDVSREFRVLRALGPTGVPVPRTVACEPEPGVLEAPFYVMDRVDGRTLRTQDDTGTLTVQQRRDLADSMLDTLVTLHDIEPAAVGLDGWGRPEGYLDRQLARWRRQWHAIKTQDHPGVDALFDRLDAAVPQTRFSGIVHGDYKIDNVLVDRDDPSRIRALLDWEMATLGDSLADLGMLVSFWDEPDRFHNPITAGATAQPGFPSAHDIVEGYARRRGIGLDDVVG
ncbi:MAG: phosphotransferase family protein, partial [Actinomycetales bacterium]